MKKRWTGILLVGLMVLAVTFCGVSPVMGGIDLEGEFNYQLDEAATDGYTQMAVDMAPEPFDLSLTWRRDWVPVRGDSLSLDAGISLGPLRLGYEKQLMEEDVGIASLALEINPLTIKYARILDGLDTGTITVRFEKSL